MASLWYCLPVRRVSTSLFPVFNRALPVYIPPIQDVPEKPKVTGLFCNPYLKEPQGFLGIKDAVVNHTESMVREALNKDRNVKMVKIFDSMSNNLCKVADLAEFVRIGHPDKRYRLSAQETSLSISREVEKLNTNRELYMALKKVSEKGDVVPTNEVDQLVAKLFLFDFELSGIHLDDKERERVMQLNDYIAHMGGFFYHRSMERVLVPKDDMPQQFWGSFQQDGKDLVVDGLRADSEDEKLREISFKLYYKADEHREKLLRQLVSARKVLAKLCGFPSYSDRSARGSVLADVGGITKFLDSVNDALKVHAQADYDRLLRVKQRFIPEAKVLYPWDQQYYSAVVRRDQFTSFISSASPYFSIGTCMDGLNGILKSIFGIQFTVEETEYGEVWAPDVIKLAVVDESNSILGHIYCDLFERAEKPHQDCHFTIQGGCELDDGSYQNPIVVLVLSLPKPQAGTPSLLAPHQVDNLFHEMGHAIHSMLARTPYQHTTGTRCSTDLAEVPSILMEYFLLDKRVITSFAKHFASGNPIPSDLAEAWIASKKLFTASDTQLQLFYAALDQAYHGADPLQGKLFTTQVLEDVSKKYYGLDYVKGTSFQLRFGHLYSYGSKYYSYLLSRAIASQIWDKVFAKNPLSREAGDIYVQKLLSHGGSKPSLAIVEDILGRSIDPVYLSDALVQDIERNSLTAESFLRDK
ncbi:mitochondrial intermediate peptidase [Brevipalpus obovatus]|uniref:mitochondrial intermediate peptidase n=1 Tax=Brevipalpus obovatus TaxID=246614 RepID=UPI003D9EB680